MRARQVACGFGLVVALASVAPAGESGAAYPERQVPSWVREIREIRGTLGGQLMFRAALTTAAGTLGLLLLAAALAPAKVEKAEELLRQARWRSVVVGVLSAVALFALAFVLVAAAHGGGAILAVPGVVLLGFLLWLAAHGLAGLARLIGRRLCGEGEWSDWRLVGTGGLALCATMLIPVFGWALFIYFFCRGVGAATLALFGVGPSAPLGQRAGDRDQGSAEDAGPGA